VRAEDFVAHFKFGRQTTRDDVARDNHATVTARGLAALDALLTDIRRDRDASYARL
jgi:hypothetical protein